ncbi:MAG: hypothetical protein R6W87_04125, partial [Halospina sp.]
WGRLVRRRHQQRSEQQQQQRAETGSPANTREWLASLQEYLRGSREDPLARYRLIAGVLEMLGESVDEDAVETLQTGLAAMNWEEAPVTVRRAASQHFRQLARVVAPPEGLRPEEGRALGMDASGEPATEGSGSG